MFWFSYCFLIDFPHDLDIDLRQSHKIQNEIQFKNDDIKFIFFVIDRKLIVKIHYTKFNNVREWQN